MHISTGLIIAVSGLAFANCSTQPNNPIYQQTTKYMGSAPLINSAPTVQQASAQTQAPAPIIYASTPNIPAPQQAGYTRVNQECLSAEANRKIIGTVAGGAIGAISGRKIAGDNKTLGTIAGAGIGGLVGNGIADKTINCDPITVPVTNIAAITPAYQPAAPIYAASTAKPQIQDQAPAIQETTQSLGSEGTPGYYAVNGMPDTQAKPDAKTHSMQASLPVPQPLPEPVNEAVGEPVYIGTPLPATPTTSTQRHTVMRGDTVYSLARKSCVKVSALKQANNINDDFYIRVGDEIIIPPSNCAK